MGRKFKVTSEVKIEAVKSYLMGTPVEVDNN